MKRSATAPLPLVLCLALGTGAACTKSAPPPPTAPTVSSAPAREAIDVMAPGGERTLRLEVESDGYSLVDGAGWPIGRAIVDDAAVRVTDRGGGTLVTVSRTEGGFSLDDGSGSTLEGTLADEGLALTRGGARVGLLASHALTLPDRRVYVVDNDAIIQVVKERDVVLEVRGPVGDGAAYLAWTELGFPERVALMLFSAELL